MTLARSLSAFIATAVLASTASAQSSFLDNGEVRIGVNRTWGSGIDQFGNARSGRNLLNRFDTGRNIQQSFYGSPDGTTFAGVPWRWNPVQGGDKYGNASPTVAYRNVHGTIYSETIPLHWAKNGVQTKSRMKQWIALEGDVAHIHYRFEYTGQQVHQSGQQEVPAPYFDLDLRTLVYYTGDRPWEGQALHSEQPAFREDTGRNQSARRVSENWAAYVDSTGWGCGAYFPGTDRLTYFASKGVKGPQGFGTSYYAPIRILQVKPGFSLDYDLYLKLGKVTDLRRHFGHLHRRRAARVFEPGFYLRANADLKRAFGTDEWAARAHWYRSGKREGRLASPFFSASHYRTRHPALAGLSDEKALAHWIDRGIAQGLQGSPVIDLAFYARTYPDLVSKSHLERLAHFASVGIAAGRQGSREFSARAYLARYPNLKAAFKNDYRAALEHYVLQGRRQGLSGRPGPGAAPRPSNAAALVSHSIPSRLARGETREVTLRLENTGSATWSRAEGYRLRALGDDPLARALAHHFPRSARIAPGQMHTFRVQLTAPAASGLYRTDWQLLRVQPKRLRFGPVIRVNVRVD